MTIDAADLVALADKPFSGLVARAVVITPEFARRIAAAIDREAVAPLDVERVIQRYTLTTDDGQPGMELDPEGRWVLWEDVEP